MANIVEVDQLDAEIHVSTLEKLASQGIIVELPVNQNQIRNLPIIEAMRLFLPQCLSITLRQIAGMHEVVYAYERGNGNLDTPFSLVGEPKVVRIIQ